MFAKLAHVFLPGSFDLFSCHAVDNHFSHVALTYQQLKKFSEELITHIQIPIGINEVAQVEFLLPDHRLRQLTQVYAVAYLTQLRRIFCTGQTFYQETELAIFHVGMSVNLKGKMSTTSQADRCPFKIAK